MSGKKEEPKAGRAKINVGRNLANTSRGQGTFGLTNKDKLKAGRAAASNLIAGTIEKNKAAADKAAGIKRNQ